MSLFKISYRWKIFLSLLSVIILTLIAFDYLIPILLNINPDSSKLIIINLIILGMMGALGFLMSMLLTTQIVSLKKGLKLLNDNKFDQELIINSGDEIEDVAQTINRLIKLIGITNKQLETDTQSLAAMKNQIDLKNNDFTKILNDISRKETVLVAEKNKFEVVLSNITDAVIGLDINHNIVTFNTAAEHLTGYTSQQAIGKPIYSLIKIYENNEELAATEYCPINQSDNKNVCTRRDVKLVGLNKEAFVDLTAGQIIQGTAGNLGCILSLHDITEQRQLEEMRLNFLSMAAHELRTPLTSIKGYLNIFMEESMQTLTDDQKTLLKRMQIALKQLMSLIENLLSVTRMDRGAFSISPRPIDWVSVVKETVDELINTAEEKQITLTFIEPTSPIAKVMADQVRATEVATNLIANAINYTPSGGSVSVFLEQTPTEVITHVQDTGEGIPPDAIPRLFQKFFRVAGKLEHGSRGTGLGLYISKTIIDMHKGKIWVESTVGKGSTFSFTLPIAPQMAV